MDKLALLIVIAISVSSFAKDEYFEKNYELCGLEGSICINSAQRDPKGKDDVVSCYWKDENGIVKLVNYASAFPMPMIEKPKYDKSKMGCFFVEGKPYVTFGTNLPKQRVGENILVSKNRLEHCYMDSVLVEEGAFLYSRNTIYSCSIDVSSPKGCHEQKDGIRMVFPNDFRCGRDDVSWVDEVGLKLFAQMIERKNLQDFMAERESFVRMISEIQAVLPYKFEDSDARALGDSAAAHAPGMYYYLGATQVDSVSFKKSPFKNLKDALDHCYDWGKKQLR